MCLDAHAHGMRVEHDIFQTPHAVTPTMEGIATPSEYADYVDSATMPMWRVQTEGYLDKTDQLVGVVSRDKGFDDSPDTEWISGGVNSKGPNAVAIGRHGNFFHWGFAASPTYLTEEAKLVFVNAVHYIANFEGHTPVARKVPGSSTRESLLSLLDGITDEGYAKRLERHERYVQRLKDEYTELVAKRERGEELTEWEAQSVARMEAKGPPAPSERFQYVRRYLPDLPWAELGDDSQLVADHVRSILPFVRANGWYTVEVDTELQRFGTGSADSTFLTKAIDALSGPEDLAAEKLLERYTDQSFETQDEWRAWMSETEGYRFFSEVAGYKWLVDTHALARAQAKD